MNRRVVRRLAVVAALFVLLPAACVTLVLWPRDGDRFVPTLDGLDVPSTWTAAHTEVVDGGFIVQERATRYYFADADPVDNLQMVKRVAEAAGFVVRPRVLSLNGCEDSFPPEAMDSPCGLVVMDDCRSNGGLPRDCTVEAIRWIEEGECIERLWISLQPRGSGFSIGRGEERQYVSDPDLALVMITADRVNRDAYVPLSSWPPAH